MAINFSDLVGGSGGGGVSATTFYSGTINVTPTGTTPIVMTPPAGQRVELIQLVSDNSGVSVSGNILGTRIDNLANVSGNSSSQGTFAVGGPISSAGINNAGVIKKLVFEIDEVVTISKIGASWSLVRYSYSYAT